MNTYLLNFLYSNYRRLYENRIKRGQPLPLNSEEVSGKVVDLFEKICKNRHLDLTEALINQKKRHASKLRK